MPDRESQDREPTARMLIREGDLPNSHAQQPSLTNRINIQGEQQPLYRVKVLRVSSRKVSETCRHGDCPPEVHGCILSPC